MAALQLGIYLNSQYPEDQDAGQCLAGLVEQVQQARALGFDSIWAGEHHLTPGFHFFPQLALLAHLAAHSGTMAIGTNLVLLPLHRPVDVAEQVALIDLACGGRFILTVGQGYRPEEFDAFGVPFAERLPRMVEGIEVIRRLWSEREVDHDAGWYRLQGATVRPGPARPGGPPIWIGATSDRAIRRGGRLGDAFMATPNDDDAGIRRQLDLFAEGRAAAGLAPATEAGRMLEVFCHHDGRTARDLARPHLLRKYAAYASWGLTGSAGQTASSAADASGADAFEQLAAGRFVIGDPDEVTAGLIRQHREVGITHLAMRVAWPGSEQADTMACLDLLGREVLPRVRAALADS
jgi:alkanesulfonate monooxygenase SsuD/methylene tetrahydromethanopterin reductase-like flavin-dependent oxidoreductase (luciferase family)